LLGNASAVMELTPSPQTSRPDAAGAWVGRHLTAWHVVDVFAPGIEGIIGSESRLGFRRRPSLLAIPQRLGSPLVGSVARRILGSSRWPRPDITDRSVGGITPRIQSSGRRPRPDIAGRFVGGIATGIQPSDERP
jgi:hypothetical protein